MRTSTLVWRLLILLALGAIANGGCGSGEPRSDTWLQEHFSRQRETFERLVRMSNEDFERTSVTRVGFNFTRLAKDWNWPRPEAEWGITRQRWDEYREIFHRLELPVGLNRHGEDYSHILLIIHARGMAGEGYEQGYLWSRVSPERTDTDREFFEARPLEGMWYLYEWNVY